jgi:hypothetical protein
MVTTTLPGAVPLVAESDSHAPPSAVLLEAVQLNVPVPALRIGIVCAAGVSVVVRKKLSSPGTLSKYAEPGASTVSTTGTVIHRSSLKYWVKTTSPI